MTILLPQAEDWVRKQEDENPKDLGAGQHQQPYLYCSVESGTEVSEYLEAFIQLHGFFVFTEKIYKGVSLNLQLPLPEFQLCQLFHSKLQGGKTNRDTRGKQGQRRWMRSQASISGSLQREGRKGHLEPKGK